MTEGMAHYNFALYTISTLETIPTQCDENILNNPDIESMCAYFPNGNASFISAWETIMMSDIIQTNYLILPISEWLYFYDSNNNVDHIKRLYSFAETPLVISYNQNMPGRELHLSIDENIPEILSKPNTVVNLNDLGITKYQLIDNSTSLEQPIQNQAVQMTQNVSQAEQTNNNASVIKGAYNCEDFGSMKKALDFFKENGFHKDNDPYNLDGDGNGIPCESIGETVGEDSRCPAGKSWVSPFTRKDGANVKGHCRKKR